MLRVDSTEFGSSLKPWSMSHWERGKPHGNHSQGVWVSLSSSSLLHFGGFVRHDAFCAR